MGRKVLLKDNENEFLLRITVHGLRSKLWRFSGFIRKQLNT